MKTLANSASASSYLSANLYPNPQCNCVTGNAEWSGAQNPDDPDNSWICDECGRVIEAE